MTTYSIGNEIGASNLGRVEASVFGESALIDRETGRVYWECGNSNTLYESLVPKLDRLGIEHVQATILTVLIALSLLGHCSRWMTHNTVGFLSSLEHNSFAKSVLSLAVVLAETTMQKLPKLLEHKWLLSVLLVLYFVESYNCSTRYLLASAMGATELDAYIDVLKQMPLEVTWKVQTFHYELRRLFALPRMLLSLPRLAFGKASSSDGATASTAPGLLRKSSGHVASMFPITRKVVTNTASTTYIFKSWSDKTIVGVWSKAPSSGDGILQKISLSKVLVLSDKRTREDYFTQQSDFVTRYGREDEFAEFSTTIDLEGYRPRLLVLQSANNSNSRDHKRLSLAKLSFFWLFTFLGCTVPYRVWFQRHCDFLRVMIVKETKAKSATDAYLRGWFPSQSSSLRFQNKVR